MEIEQVAANLEKHEAICAERWKTIFNKIVSMEKGASDRFNGIEEQVSRIETIFLYIELVLLSLISLIKSLEIKSEISFCYASFSHSSLNFLTL